jgi:hypothetical protein
MWGDNTGEVQSPILQSENPRSRLNLLGLAMALLNALFCEQELSPGKKTYDL